MKEIIEHCKGLSDELLTRDLKTMVDRERQNLSGLLVHLGEYDRRRLYRGDGFQSLFIYCVKRLGYDESGAYRRITAARVLRRYPHIHGVLESGELSLTSLLLLSPVLTDENQERLFTGARGKSRRELETLVAGINPLAPHGDWARRHPMPPPDWRSAGVPQGATPPAAAQDIQGAIESTPESAASSAVAGPLSTPHEWQAIVPISLDRIRIGFDAASVVMGLIDRARQILRHKYPEGRLEDVLKEALELLIDRKDPQRRLGLKPQPKEALPMTSMEPRFIRASKAGRYIPARVKQAVWQRDGGRCGWRFDNGAICGSRELLEFDHIRPFAKGGFTEARNLRLLCRAHHQLTSEAAYGLSVSPTPSSTASASSTPPAASDSPA